MTKTITRSSDERLNKNMLDLLELGIDVTDNPYNLDLGDVFLLGARKNPKRNFLFVSKLIGKHISVPPLLPLVSGGLLCDQFLKEVEGESPMESSLLAKALHSPELLKQAYEEINAHSISLSKPTLFIGFAETATGLGHAVFSPISDNASFIHTTREDITDLESSFNFEEEHSHATSHMCYGMKPEFFDGFERIVLVDDEITTGNTALNLVRSLNQHFPNKEYVVVSLLDWRQQEDLDRHVQTEKELGVSIKVVRLIAGSVSYTNKPVAIEEVYHRPIEQESIDIVTVGIPVQSEHSYSWTVKTSLGEKTKNYHRFTGRFGLDASEKEEVRMEVSRIASLLRGSKEYEKTLMLGTGEYMFLPFAIASEVGDTVYHSTTRSPIYTSEMPGYPVRNVFPYLNPDDPSVMNYVYNVEPHQYDEVFMFFEEDIREEDKNYLAHHFLQLGVKSLKFVVFDY